MLQDVLARTAGVVRGATVSVLVVLQASGLIFRLVCQTQHVCQTSFTSVGGSTSSGSSSSGSSSPSISPGQVGNQTLACNTKARVYAAQEMSCAVVVCLIPSFFISLGT